MTVIIPKDNKWVQTNRSDIFGSLLGSFNLDLTKNVGKTRANRMLMTTTQTTNTSLTAVPVGFKVFDDVGGAPKIWTVSGSFVHHNINDTTISPFIKDATASSPTDCDSTMSDIEIFVPSGSSTPRLYVTSDAGLSQNSAGTWATNNFAGGGPWMMTVFGPRLYIAVGGLGQIYSTTNGTSIDTPTTTGTLDLNGARITFIRAASNRIWIGTMATSGKGYIYEWDGASAQTTRSYRLEAQGAISCVIKDDVPWIVDSNGRLMVYYSGTFKEMARLPLNDKFLLNATAITNNRFIHPNGMTVTNSRINLLINNVIDDSVSSIPEYCPSGVWEYDPDIGLYHKYSASYTSLGSNTITDYGQNRLSAVGGLSEMKLSNPNAAATGDILAGIKTYTNLTDTNVGVFTNDTFDAVTGTTGQKATQAFGYSVTTKIRAAKLLDAWKKLFVLHEKFLTATDRIIVKGRSSTVLPTEATITWTSTNSFTTSTDVSAYAVGDEIEVTQGTGGGLCAHITALQVGSGPSYIITLDETFTGATGTGKARFQKWRKIGEVQDTGTNKDILPGAFIDPSDYLELKICFLFTGKNEFKEAVLLTQIYNDYS